MHVTILHAHTVNFNGVGSAEDSIARIISITRDIGILAAKC